MSPALLSKVQNGKRNLSFESAVRVSKRLQLQENETEYFCLLVQLETSTQSETQEAVLSRIQALNRKRSINHLPLDQFRMIADWYHIPILEMTKLKNFKFTPQNVASRLGISAIEASAAIDRLVRLKLIEKVASDRYRKSVTDLMIESEAANESLRQFHRQMLDKAHRSIQEQGPEEKFVGTETIAISKTDLPEARKRIGKFMDDLVDLFEPAETKTDIYHLGVQFFRLTRKKPQ